LATARRNPERLTAVDPRTLLHGATNRSLDIQLIVA
jgi:hypothetical protein